MSIRQFRRPRRWRYLFGGVALLLMLIRALSRDDQFDPHRTIVRAGQYKLTRVRDDGLLVVELKTPSGKIASVDFELLGIQLEDAQACARAIRGVAGDTVRLRFDRRRIDEQGRLQAYVFADELLLNEELVRRGLAREATHAADYGPIVRRLKRAEQKAKAEQIGIWKAASRDSD